MEKNSMCPVGTKIQSLIIDKEFFDEKEAKEWAKSHDFKYGKLDVKEKSYRFRQLNPSFIRKGTFRTIELTDGVQAVIGCPIPEFENGGDIDSKFDELIGGSDVVVNNTCIKQSIWILQDTFPIKDWFILSDDSKLVIIFKKELTDKEINDVKSILSQFTECHYLLSVETLQKNDNGRSISIDLKHNNVTVGEFADGGGVGIVKGDNVIWNGNKYVLIKVENNLVGGLNDVKYHLLSTKKGVRDAVLDSLNDVKKYADGGEVKFIEYKGNEIMFEPHFKEYFVGDEQFSSLEDAKKYIDDGSKLSQKTINAYRHGAMKDGGIIMTNEEEKEYTDLIEFKKNLRGQDALDWLNRVHPRYERFSELGDKYIRKHFNFENGGGIESDAKDNITVNTISGIHPIWKIVDWIISDLDIKVVDYIKTEKEKSLPKLRLYVYNRAKYAHDAEDIHIDYITNKIYEKIIGNEFSNYEESLNKMIKKLEEEITSYEELKNKLTNNLIKPYKIIGRGIKPQYARKLAFESIDESLSKYKADLIYKKSLLSSLKEGKNIILYYINGKGVIKENEWDNHIQVEYISGTTEAYSKKRLSEIKALNTPVNEDSAQVIGLPDAIGDDMYSNFFKTKEMDASFGDELVSYWNKKKADFEDEYVSKLRAVGFSDKDIFGILFGYISIYDLKCDREFSFNGILKQIKEVQMESIDEIIESKNSGYYEAGLKYPITEKHLIDELFDKYKINETPLVFDLMEGVGKSKMYIYKGDGIYLGKAVNEAYGEKKPLDKYDSVNKGYMGIVTDSIKKLYDSINILFREEDCYIKDLNVFYNNLGGIDSKDIEDTFGKPEVKEVKEVVIPSEVVDTNSIVDLVKDEIQSIKDAIEYLQAEADSGDEEAKDALDYLQDELKSISGDTKKVIESVKSIDSFSDLNNPENITGFVYRPTGDFITVVSDEGNRVFQVLYNGDKISSIELWGKDISNKPYWIKSWVGDVVGNVFSGDTEIEKYEEGGETLLGGKADYMSLDEIADMHGVTLDHILRQSKIGAKVEREHTSDDNKIVEIVKDHLYESPDYYTKLQQIESSFESKGSGTYHWLDVPNEYKYKFMSLSSLNGLSKYAIDNNGSSRFLYNNERDIDNAISILNIVKNPNFNSAILNINSSIANSTETKKDVGNKNISSDLEEKQKRILKPEDFNNKLEYNLDTESVSCFIHSKSTGRTLVMRRAGGSDFNGTWALVSGGVELGESNEETIKREIQEEMGIDLNCDGLIFMDAVKHPDRTHYYYELSVDDEFEPIMNHENDAYMWINMAELPKNTHPLLLKFIKMKVFA